MSNKYQEYIKTPTESLSITPSTSAQTLDVTDKATANVAAMPTGTLGAASASKSISGNTATVTPNVAAGTAGYNAMAAYSGTAVTVSASELVSGTTNITTMNSTDVTNSQYAQVVDSDLVAANIKSGVDILGVTGTANTIDTVSSVPSTKSTDVIYNTSDSSYYAWEYPITTTLTNVSASASNVTSIPINQSVTLTFTANTGYALPDSITVSGASYTYTKSSGTIILSNPTGNVTISISGILVSYDVTFNVAGGRGYMVYDGTSTSGQLLGQVSSSAAATYTITSGNAYCVNTSGYVLWRSSSSVSGGVSFLDATEGNEYATLTVTGDGTAAICFDIE